MKEVVHIKTGRKYIIIKDNIINGTNINDGQIMVLYCGEKREGNEIGLFVREKEEFFNKFEII